MRQWILRLSLLLSGCTPLLIEQRAATLDTIVRTIQTDFRALSATLTPEQSAKYARARAVQDDTTYREFYASLDARQQETMQALLAGTTQVEQERQYVETAMRQDLALRRTVPPIGPPWTSIARGL